MKKYMLFTMLLMAFLAYGCDSADDDYTNNFSDKSIPSFDFNVVLSEYSVTKDFINTTPSAITNKDEAIAIAKNECTVDYEYD